MQQAQDLHIISHTHWDREWYLTFQQFRFRLVELIDALLELLERDSDFRYFHLDGQTIVLEDYLQIRPDREHQLRELIAAGRVLVGPWYVQPDEFLVSGESIIRNLQIGLRIARRYGEPMMIGYLPDSFGHIAQLPQLLRGFELDTFVHGRGIALDRTGGTEYWWQGLDGSQVLGIFLANWYNNAQRFPDEPGAALQYLEQCVARLRAANADRHLLLMNGVDHLVAQENLTAIRRQLEERYTAGELIHAALPEAIAAIKQSLRPDLNVVQGELRHEEQVTLLSGVLSARVYLKQANNATERLLEQWVEPYEAWSALLGKRYDRDFLRYAWKTLLQNHPHDSICGCSIDQVHREMLPRFTQAQQIGQELLDRSFSYLAAQIDTSSLPAGDALATTAVVVHNPTPRPRSEVAIFELDFPQRPEYCSVELVDQAGQLIATQVLARSQCLRKRLSPSELPRDEPVSRYTIAADLREVPACGYRTFTARLIAQPPRSDTSLFVAGGLENEYLRVEVAPDGTLRLQDKVTGQVYEQLHFFRDEADIGDQYDYYKPVADRAVETLSGTAEVNVLRTGPLVGELEVTLRPHVPRAIRADRSERSAEMVELPLRSRLRLLRGSRQVAVTTELENTAADHRLRVVFPLGAPLGEVAADSSFSVVRRPVATPAVWPFPSRNRPHRSLIDARSNGRGLAILSRGLYEHDARADGQLELTLLRCVGHMFLDYATLSARDPAPEGQCPGLHRFEYAIVPHAGDRPLYELVEAAAGFNAPLRTWQSDHHAGSHPALHSFLELQPTALQLSAVKYAEDRDSLIVRFYNASDRAVAGAVRVSGTWGAAYRTNLDERRQRAIPFAAAGTIAIEARPWEIMTVELERAAATE